MEVYEDDCGGGAEGAGEPHVGEILGVRVPLGQLSSADAMWREKRERSISSAPSR